MAQTLLGDSCGEHRRRKLVGEVGDVDADVHNHYADAPIRFLPLRHVYSATSPCSGASNVVSKKIKARKLTEFDGGGNRVKVEDEEMLSEVSEKRLPKVIRVYSRRKQKKAVFDGNEVVIGGGEIVVKSEPVDEVFDDNVVDFPNKKRRSSEVAKLGGDSSLVCADNTPRLRESRFRFDVNVSKTKGVKRKRGSEGNAKDRDSSKAKKWFRLTFDGAEQAAFIGLKCEVYWPLDNAWYKARIAGYDAESNRHTVKYDDGDEEELVLSQEQIKFYISKEEMQKLNLEGSICMDDDDPDYSQLIGLAATVDESRDLEPGDIIWAKVTGHAMWPAVIMDESLVSDRKGLKASVGRSLPVQFFGTHDFARVQVKQIVSFVKGLVSCFHLKCKSPHFLRGLKEAKTYLNEQKLPKSMLNMQCMPEEVQNVSSDEGSEKDEGLSYLKAPSESSAQKKLYGRYQNMPSGYRPIRIKWKDLDRCNVCHMDEEYENNLFLQCDKCRMMVHARCYGEESAEGSLWLCNLCRDGAPESTPPCRLCPVVGGAMKRTTDGHWAHLACAIWIPETCLSDIKRMEPIDGLSRINKDRWKLLCSICDIPYGACIQCSNNTCRVAYHPLCARASGFCVELEDEDRLHLMSFDEDEEDQCIRLLSFCKKHKQSKDHPHENEQIDKDDCPSPSYIPPLNASGCARCEPYDYSGRRGRKEPEVLAAASVKRLYVENRPYLVGGHCQHDSLSHISSENKVLRGSKFSTGTQNAFPTQSASQNIRSMSDKYKYMRETFRKRLAFGKSRIHGFGIFAKQPHRAGDMIIEYTGEIVRPPVADRREHIMYNSLVGAGTYMFRIDDERVIDATRAGSVAHLINHACQPNCYSRVITVNGDKHIIIFAKREIKQWEELTYDYRFFALDEQLPCHCGSQKCRGVVNDLEAEEQASKLYVPRNELIEWKGE